MSGDVLVTRCTQSKIKEIAALRSSGETYAEIALMVGHSSGAVNRWLRLYRLHGIEAFASDETQATRKRNLRAKNKRAKAREATECSVRVAGSRQVACDQCFRYAEVSETNGGKGPCQK